MPTFEEITEFSWLCRAARRAARGHRSAPSMAWVLFHLETVVFELQRELRSRSYRPRPYRTFTIHDPKKRTISVADPRDRVVHHALCAALEPLFDARMSDDSYACRRGRGTHRAVFRVRGLVKRFPFFLKMDIRHFFETLDHGVLKAMVRQVLSDEGVLWLGDLFVDNGAPGSPAGKGLPIGNLTSQHFANFYLSGLDRHVGHDLNVPGYVRYMDDLLLFGQSKRELHEWEASVTELLERTLALQVKTEATVLAPVTEGVAFLGFRVYPGCVRLSGAHRRRLIGRLREAQRDLMEGRPEDAVARSIGSVIAHAAHADTLALRRSLMEDRVQGHGATRARTG